ncbi:MAG: M28 family peptidase [Candidatus Krumholzibacteriota bacterium]|nr:M28 family peptidase [Candidatus Krumholzibacteriota bacterium]
MRTQAIAAATILLASLGCGAGELPRFDGEKAMALLVRQCEMGPRYPGSAAHREYRKWLVDRLESCGASVSVQPFDGVLSTGDTLRLVNIIGNFNGKAGTRVLLGAHYDTRPRADRDPDPARRDEPIVGANDGASGVAVLLEIARLLGESEPPVGVDIVLFDGEDYGEEGNPDDYCLGSAWFAAHLRGYRPVAVVVVDMIGERGVEIPVEGYSGRYAPRVVDELWGIAGDLAVDAFVRKPGPAVIDDHVPFIREGLQAVDLIDFEYPWWHTLEDTPDKCSAESLEAVGTVLVAWIWSL